MTTIDTFAPGSCVEQLTDADLLERHRGGDHEALPVLVDRHWAWVVNRCRRHLGGDAFEAEDVAQECFVRLHAALARGPIDQLRPWLAVVARNRCIDVRRRRRPEPIPESPDDLADGRGATPAQAGFEGSVDAVGNPWLTSAWRSLKHRHQRVLELREIKGLSYHEIAVVLAITPAAVETLLFRARGALRREYVKAGGSLATLPPADLAMAHATGSSTLAERLLSLSAAGARVNPPSLTASSRASDLMARAASSPAMDAAVAAASTPGSGRVAGAIGALGLVLGLLTGGVTAEPPAAAPDQPPAVAPALPAAPSAPLSPAPPTAPDTATPEAPAAPAAPATDQEALDAEAPAADDPAGPSGPVGALRTVVSDVLGTTAAATGQLLEQEILQEPQDRRSLIRPPE